VPNRRASCRAGLWIVIALLGGVWLTVETERAAHKPFWLDEAYALHAAVRGTGFARLLLSGAPGQASPSPLDYLLLKGLDEGRTTVAYFRLPPHAYYRLIALLSTVGAAAFAFGLALPARLLSRTTSKTTVACALSACAFVSFVLERSTFYYAAEMRPYALWTALWLVSALSLLRTTKGGRTVTIVALVLLAMTATASVFQLAALAAAALCVGLAGKEPLARLGREVLILFALPLAVCLFYCVRVGHWDYPADWCAWARFFPFWASHWWVAAASLAAATLCLTQRATHAYAVPPLAMAIFYLLGPVMFETTKLKGFFFTERQYVAYGAAVPILCVTCALVLSAEAPLKGVRVRRGLVFLVAGAALLGTAHSGWRTIRSVVQDSSAWGGSPGIPSDSARVLSTLLQHEMPRAFCFAGTPTNEALANVRVVAEWLPVRYSSLPVGEKTVFLAAHGDFAEVLELGDSCDSKPAIPVVRTQPR